MSENLNNMIDAKVWTENFISTIDTLPDNPEKDFGFVIGWFANSIEAGQKEGYKRARSDLKKELLELAKAASFRLEDDNNFTECVTLGSIKKWCEDE